MGGLDQKPNKQAPDYKNRGEGAKNISAVIAVRVLKRGLFSGQINCQERDDKASDIRQLVGSVAQDSQRARDRASCSLDTTENAADGSHKNELVAGATRFNFFFLEMFGVLQSAPVREVLRIAVEWSGGFPLESPVWEQLRLFGSIFTM